METNLSKNCFFLAEPHRVFELSKISCVLTKYSLCSFLKTGHPLTVTMICHVDLTKEKT